MAQSWTFGQRLGAGFALMVALAALIGGLGIRGLRGVVASKDRVISQNAQSLIDAQRLRAAVESRVAANRGYLVVPEERFIESMRAARDECEATLARLLAQASSDEARRALEQIERQSNELREVADRSMALRRTATPTESVVQQFTQEVMPRREALDRQIGAFVTAEERRLDEARRAATDAAGAASAQMLGLTGLALLAAIAVALLLTRALSRQIGAAVQHVQSSSAELQSAVNQQAASTKEQATAVTEIATTISELLATSRQIAESARRVTQIAEETAGAARTGTQTVQTAQEALGAIRRQVDLIVGHMLDLGRKSQQIGGILEIINELAEQTNILAINATIEAAGAGEAGRRFAVVADEIRKLADRVGGSTKEIRSLIEEIRGAVNTTVMTTEGGAKAVEAGARHFSEVTAAFRRIAELVGTTTEAAREIELSTKQQTTAVEQVNVAIANVAQTTRETEVSAGQTLQTTAQLANLARDLARLIRPSQ